MQRTTLPVCEGFQKTPLPLWNTDVVVVRLRLTNALGVPLTALSDTELLQSAREGNQTALTELFLRHRSAARRVAASSRRGGDPDDLVNDAFEKVFAAINRQKGPTEAFRAYLFVTIRRLAARNAARNHDEPYDEVPEPVIAAASSPTLDAAERQIVTRAFGSLPERWQAVLWHTAVEGRNPREVAASLGMKANAVSALAYRAREKLRQAYLQAHLQAAPHPECEPHRSALGAYVRDGLGKREHTSTARHVGSCESCQMLVDELVDVNQLLARSVMPMFVATGIGEAVLEIAAGAAGAATPSGLATSAVSELSDAYLADLLEVADIAEIASTPGRIARMVPQSIGASHVVGGVAASLVLLVALGTTGSMLLDKDESGPSTTTTGSAETSTSTTSPDENRDGNAERPAQALETLDLANSATCLPEATAPSEDAADVSAEAEVDKPAAATTESSRPSGPSPSDEPGPLGLKLDLMLPLDLDPDHTLEQPTIQEVACDTSSGDGELVVTIGENEAAEEPAPEAEEPDRVLDVEAEDINVDALPGVLPEVEAGADLYLDEELGVGATLETNLNELCDVDEERGNLVCHLDSALGGVVTGTLSETGAQLELDGPGGQVIALELLTEGDVVVDTKVLNLLP